VLVTAVVSTYNAERFLRGCLEDLLAQTIADRLEIIVVNSGSEQHERLIVEELRREHDNIRYIRTDERETVYAAWNRAIEVARGTYLTNANTDDRRRADAFERMVAELEANPTAALAYADVAITETENATFETAPVVAYFRWPRFSLDALFRTPCIGPQPMWRRELHARYGLFDDRLCVAGDYDWWLRLASAGESFHHIPEVLGLYLLSRGNLERADPDLANSEAEQARRRHWDPAWGRRPPEGGSHVRTAGGLLAEERERLIREQETWIRELREANAWLAEHRENWERLAEGRGAYAASLEQERAVLWQELEKRRSPWWQRAGVRRPQPLIREGRGLSGRARLTEM